MAETLAGCPGGLLAVFVDVPPEIKADFDLWYDTEHMPERREVPGFLSAARFEAVDGSVSNLALYELAGPEVLESPAYQALRQRPSTALGSRVRAGWRDQNRLVYTLRSVRGGSTRIDAPFVQTLRLTVTPGWEDAIREWMDVEHSVVLTAVPGVRSCHGFESVEGPFHFLNVWGLEGPAVTSSAEWRAARDTPWRERLIPVWEKVIRRVYRRV